MTSVHTVLRSVRRLYRQAMIANRLRRASKSGHKHGLRVVHMLHVRKTGGTAIKAALEQAETPPGLRLLMHGHGISLRNLPPGDEVFFFLREPVARFVSGFEMRRREGRPSFYRAWTPAERRAFSRFPSAEALALALRSNDRSEQAEAERAMHSIEHVRSGLTDWLVDEHEVRRRKEHLIFIGWQERLEADFAALAALLGLPPTTRLSQDPHVANRSESTEQPSALSMDASETIRAWYAEDYRLIRLLLDLGLTDPPKDLTPEKTQSA